MGANDEHMDGLECAGRISYPVERLESLRSKCNWLIDNMPKIMQTTASRESTTEMAFLRYTFSSEVIEFLKTLDKQLDLEFDEARWTELYRARDLPLPNI